MFEILSREERIRMAREMGDGHRFMALKSNARKGFPMLNIDPATLRYLEACEALVMSGGGWSKSVVV